MLCLICRTLRQSQRTLPSSLSPRTTTTTTITTTTNLFRLRRSQTTQQTSPTPTRPRFYTTPPQRSSPQPAIPPEQPSMSAAEESIAERLRQELQPTELLVRDVSGGCGSMYAIDIASPAFRGLSMLKQQRMVNAALRDVMRGWHGLQLNTRVSD
ncbi:hypothetical protein E4U55_002102 [Claviceps digitariae]|nr:hypothetical protein E4U55_002102 [Claviceps digitariae]